jgi:hypothetical protein
MTTDLASQELKGQFDAQIGRIFAMISDQIEALRAERPSVQLVESWRPAFGRKLMTLEIHCIIGWFRVLKICPETTDS